MSSLYLTCIPSEPQMNFEQYLCLAKILHLFSSKSAVISVMKTGNYESHRVLVVEVLDQGYLKWILPCFLLFVFIPSAVVWFPVKCSPKSCYKNVSSMFARLKNDLWPLWLIIIIICLNSYLAKVKFIRLAGSSNNWYMKYHKSFE